MCSEAKHVEGGWGGVLDSPSLITLVEYSITLLFLIPFAIYDYRRRDIPDKLVYLFLATSIILGILAYMHVETALPIKAVGVYFFISAVPLSLVLLVLAELKLVGFADFFVVLSLSIMYGIPMRYPTLLASTTIPIPPISFYVLINALLLQLVIHYSITIARLLRHGFKVPEGLGVLDKAYLLIAGWPIRVGEVVDKEYYTPLLEPFEREFGGVEWRITRLTRMEDSGLRSRISEFLERGLILYDEIIWASYGHPLVTYIAAGFIVYILLGV